MLNHFIGKLFGRAVGCPCHEDLFDFALDGLDAGGQSKVRQHLADCPHCRDQVKDYAWVSEGIALTAPQIDPPANMCDKVKERIRAEAEGTQAPVLRLGKDPLAGWPRFWMRLGPIFALSSLVMTALAFFAAFSRPAPGAASPELQAEARILDNPGLKLVSLNGQAGPGAGHGSIFVAPGLGQVLLKVYGLKACSQGSAYALWSCPKGGKPAFLGSFSPVEGRCSYVLSLPKPLDMAAAPLDFEITLQDGGQGAQEKGPTSLRGRYNL